MFKIVAAKPQPRPAIAQISDSNLTFADRGDARCVHQVHQFHIVPSARRATGR